MKPLFSDDERIKAVKNFVVARYQGLAKIISFMTIVPYLNENRIEMLKPLRKSGLGAMEYASADAQEYFEWLVAVVTGAEDASQDIVKQANDQLFQFIYVMRDSIQMDRNVQLLTPYNWQALFTSFDERLTDMQRIIDRGDKDIVEVLKPILEMMKRNTKLLDALQKGNERVFGKGNTP
jgi:hypothetical protein